MKPGRLRNKRSPKQDFLLELLRERIARGEYAPGSRLPARADLGSGTRFKLGDSSTAFDSLARDGFIRAAGRQGTFVVDHPPHLHHFAIAFRNNPSERTVWARFCDDLQREIVGIESRSPRRLRTYFDINGHADVEDYQRLLADIRAHRIGGVIFPGGFTTLFDGTPLMDEPRLARVVIGPTAPANVPRVFLDWSSFFRQAMRYFAERGRKRVALVSYRDFYKLQGEHFDQSLATFGLHSQPYWIQEPEWTHDDGIRRCVHLLMRGPAEDRPDAVIIADNNLVAGAAQGIADAGIRVPQDADVIAFANLPYTIPTVVPVHDLGFSVPGMLATCLEIIDQQVRGETVSPLTLAPIVSAEATTTS